ncbi:manganese efflux pump MntP [Roseburia sp. 499]|uniref:manganese efflux pump MntP n=1 Tax=Roseburia sp. 499 TaxID=1261634 RepID=UPI0009511B69|nr:manganese efflux pump [Roseburia sp. 499]WVK69493.1 manganese efflux pump [Roseburia sp. 499]
MNIIEELIIIMGISLDIFAVMECQGSLVAKIEKKHLALMSAVLVVGQVLAIGIGNFLSVLLGRHQSSDYEIFLEEVLAVAIFLCMGIRLLLKAWRNECIIEHREEKFNMREFVQLYIRNCMFTLLIGIAFGFLGCGMLSIMLMVVIMTVAGTILGMYTGYHLGYEHKVKAYLGGGILLIAAGIDVIVRYVVKGI